MASITYIGVKNFDQTPCTIDNTYTSINNEIKKNEIQKKHTNF